MLHQGFLPVVRGRYLVYNMEAPRLVSGPVTLTSFPMTPSRSLSSLKEADEKLVHNLEHRLTCPWRVRRWRNRDLQRERALCDSERGLLKLQRKLERAGAFDIRIERRRWRDTDGTQSTFTLARAASTKMWPMGTHYWVRDNAIIGARYLFSRERRYTKRGRDILLSALTFMSSTSQLSRWRAIVQSNSESFRDDPANWPYIFAAVKGNLNASHVEHWAHKQDAWQIAVFYTLEAIEKGLLSVSDLSQRHKVFIGHIIPFLAKVSFWKMESSGSWEELPAVRTSVRAWEHRLIVKLAKLSRRREFGFIGREFGRLRKHLGPSLRRASLERVVQHLEKNVIAEVLSDLPDECPRYNHSDPRYRESDAALIYLLLIDYPYFLAARLGADHSWAHALEAAILKKIEKLDDNATGAIYRYGNDCYQRSGYFRNLTAARLTAMYGGPSGDASSNFVARNRIVPKGRKAAWTHFVWQLAAWSGRRFIETESSSYLRLHNKYFMQGMALLTGRGEASIDQDASGVSRIISLPRLRMPECYISEVSASGRPIIFASPHTPLNWAVAEMLQAFTVRREVLQKRSR